MKKERDETWAVYAEARRSNSRHIERLKLEPESILSIHTLNPDRLATKAGTLNSPGRKTD